VGSSNKEANNGVLVDARKASRSRQGAARDGEEQACLRVKQRVRDVNALVDNLIVECDRIAPVP
jgi:hypothetical protein